MIIRLQNPFTALSRPKTHQIEVEKAPLSAEERVKSDRLVTVLLLTLVLVGTVVYQILYSL